MSDKREMLKSYLRSNGWDAYDVLSEYFVEYTDDERVWTLDEFEDDLRDNPWFYIHGFRGLDSIDEEKHSFIMCEDNRLRGLTEDQMGELAAKRLSEDDDFFDYILNGYSNALSPIKDVLDVLKSASKSPTRKTPAKRKAPAKRRASPTKRKTAATRKPATRRKTTGARR